MKNPNGKIVGALLIGTALGAALGILFAPDKGSDTRKKIKSKGEDLTDNLKDKFNSMVEGMRKEVDTIKHKAEEMIGSKDAKANQPK